MYKVRKTGKTLSVNTIDLKEIALLAFLGDEIIPSKSDNVYFK